MPLFLGIPAHIRQDLCKVCIDTALAGDRPPDGVVVVDNYGGFGHDDPRVRVVRPKENLGVARSWNLLRRLTWPHELVLSNDDIAFAPWALGAAERLRAAAPFVTLCGWSCFWQSREVWGAVGDYDESFWPGYFEDNDYHHRMKLAGFAVTNLDGGAVTHVGSATLKAETEVNRQTIQRCFEKNRDYYVRKWGGLPGQERHVVPFTEATA